MKIITGHAGEYNHRNVTWDHVKISEPNISIVKNSEPNDPRVKNEQPFSVRTPIPHEG